jgi:hypothetical protein
MPVGSQVSSRRQSASLVQVMKEQAPEVRHTVSGPQVVVEQGSVLGRQTPVGSHVSPGAHGVWAPQLTTQHAPERQTVPGWQSTPAHGSELGRQRPSAEQRSPVAQSASAEHVQWSDRQTPLAHTRPHSPQLSASCVLAQPVEPPDPDPDPDPEPELPEPEPALLELEPELLLVPVLPEEAELLDPLLLTPPEELAAGVPPEVDDAAPFAFVELLQPTENNTSAAAKPQASERLSFMMNVPGDEQGRCSEEHASP